MAAILVVMCAILFVALRRPVAVSVTPPSDNESGGGMVIGYATEGITIIDDADALQREVDEMYAEAQREGIGLEYQNDAYSSDGRNFTCYIGNAPQNGYDMFIAIYADDALQDLLFLSALLKPGQAFSDIQLTRALESGAHTVNCVFTQVEVVDGEQAIHAQTAVTLDFYVR
jgi:hypothetical protein